LGENHEKVDRFGRIHCETALIPARSSIFSSLRYLIGGRKAHQALGIHVRNSHSIQIGLEHKGVASDAATMGWFQGRSSTISGAMIPFRYGTTISQKQD
jgi:hypothetical protein